MECSTLHLVLQMSRWLGLAPFVRAPDYRVSRAIDVCGKIVYTFANMLIFIALVYFALVHEDDGDLTMYYIHLATRIFMVIIVFVGNYTAFERMTRMFRILKELDQIDTNLLGQRRRRYRKMNIMLMICVSCSLLARIMDLTVYFVYDLTLHNALKVVLLLVYQKITFMELQIMGLAGRVLETLLNVNNSLEQLKPEKHSVITRSRKNSRPVWENTQTSIEVTMSNVNKRYRKNVNNILNLATEEVKTENTIRQLALHYFNICEIVRCLTDSDGYLMMMHVIVHILIMELDWHRIVMWFAYPTTIPYYYMFPSIVRSVVNSLVLILYTEVFHQTHKQMERTRKIINGLKYHTDYTEEVNNELELFDRMLLLNETTYSPLDMFTLSRSLIAKIFGCIVTYFVIMLTYSLETKTTIYSFL